MTFELKSRKELYALLNWYDELKKNRNTRDATTILFNSYSEAERERGQND